MPPYFHEGFEDFVQLVVPILQERGLFRTDYEGTTRRDHLGLRRPANALFDVQNALSRKAYARGPMARRSPKGEGATRPASYVSARKNIENNPMQRKEPLENKGVAGMDANPAKTF
jgi:hypothetical protein